MRVRLGAKAGSLGSEPQRGSGTAASAFGFSWASTSLSLAPPRADESRVGAALACVVVCGAAAWELAFSALEDARGELAGLLPGTGADGREAARARRGASIALRLAPTRAESTGEEAIACRPPPERERAMPIPIISNAQRRTTSFDVPNCFSFMPFPASQ